MIKLKTAWLFSVLATALMACGGGGPVGPQPLKYKFDEMYIARVPPAEQSEVIAAQSEFQKARMALATADNSHKEWNTQIEMARNERKVAVLMQSSAKTKKKAAEASGDMNRVNAATREIRGLEMAAKAADLKVTYYKGHHKYLKINITYAKTDMLYKKALHELAKAEVAKEKNIRPKGFVYINYKKQSDGRVRDVQRAKFKADREKVKAEKLKANWQKQQAAADKVRGVTPTGDSTGTVTSGGNGDPDAAAPKDDDPDNSTPTKPDETTTPPKDEPTDDDKGAEPKKDESK